MSKNILVKLAESLDNAKILYMIIGGQAVLLYGEPRLTRDIDITLALTPDELNRILEIVRKINLKVLVENIVDFVRKHWVLPAFDEESGFRIDFIFSWTPYEKEALERARIFEIEKYPIKFASPEDLIIHKIISGRTRDLDDIRTIMRKQSLNIKLIEKWLKIFSQTLNEDFWKRFEQIYKEEFNEL